MRPLSRSETNRKESNPMRGEGRTFQRGSRWWIAYYAPDPDTGRKKETREPGGDSEDEARSS